MFRIIHCIYTPTRCVIWTTRTPFLAYTLSCFYHVVSNHTSLYIQYHWFKYGVNLEKQNWDMYIYIYMEKIWVKLYISFNDIVYIIMLFSVFFPHTFLCTNEKISFLHFFFNIILTLITFKKKKSLFSIRTKYRLNTHLSNLLWIHNFHLKMFFTHI